MRQAAKRLEAYQGGLFAETAAAVWLRLKRYRILARRYKTPVGEIDIIACKKNVLAIIEVKRRAKAEDALECLTPHMRSRIERAAGYFLSRHPACASMNIRFDLITFVPPLALSHLDNAWQPAP